MEYIVQSQSILKIQTLQSKNIYLILTTIERHLREFQFKIIHNYLPVNSKLFKYKLIPSDRCSYCFVSSETVKHIFCNCFPNYKFIFYKK